MSFLLIIDAENKHPFLIPRLNTCRMLQSQNFHYVGSTHDLDFNFMTAICHQQNRLNQWNQCDTF